ncbi:cytochrome P450 [Mycolicibacterium litorale]
MPTIVLCADRMKFRIVFIDSGIQRDQRFWRDPESYDPTRFLDDR